MMKRKVPYDHFALGLQGFNLKGEESYKTWLGFAATLVLIGVVIGVFLTGIVSMFQRDNLVSSISEESIPDPPELNVKDVVMAFSVTERERPLKSLTLGVDFNIKAFLRTMKIYGQPREVGISTIDLEMGICTDEYFGDLASQFKNIGNIEGMYCIKKKENDDPLWTLRGRLGSDIYTHFYVEIDCGGKTDTTCPSNFATVNVLFYYAYSHLDATNYETPVSKVATGFLSYANPNSIHEKKVTITEREIISDAGFIFSDLKSEIDLIVTEGETTVNTVSGPLLEVFNFQIQLDTKKITITREYRKILDVLATTTGIASTIAFVAAIVLKPYIELNAHNSIMRNLFPDKYVDVTIKDYFRALTGNRASQEKIRRIKVDKENIEKRMDLVRMIKNEVELEKLKKIVSSEDPNILHYGNYGESFLSEKRT